MEPLPRPGVSLNHMLLLLVGFRSFSREQTFPSRQTQGLSSRAPLAPDAFPMLLCWLLLLVSVITT